MSNIYLYTSLLIPYLSSDSCKDHRSTGSIDSLGQIVPAESNQEASIPEKASVAQDFSTQDQVVANTATDHKDSTDLKDSLLRQIARSIKTWIDKFKDRSQVPKALKCDTIVNTKEYNEVLATSTRDEIAKNYADASKKGDYDKISKMSTYLLAWDIKHYIQWLYCQTNLSSIDHAVIVGNIINEYKQCMKETLSEEVCTNIRYWVLRYNTILKVQLRSEIMMKSRTDDLVDLNPNLPEHKAEWNACNCHAIAASAVMHQCGFVDEQVSNIYTTDRGWPVDSLTANFQEQIKNKTCFLQCIQVPELDYQQFLIDFNTNPTLYPKNITLDDKKYIEERDGFKRLTNRLTNRSMQQK